MPHAKHVIFIGFDGMGSYAVQRAHTPNINRLIENGAVSLDTRSVRSTVSSQNWMSMVSGAPSQVHGVHDNSWLFGDRPYEPGKARNSKNLFPAMRDDLRAARPDALIYGFIEWGGETWFYDLDTFDKVVCNEEEAGQDYSSEDIMNQALEAYFEDQPDLLFVSVVITDNLAHHVGHESEEFLDCVNHMDEMVGHFVSELEKRGLMDDTVLMITADHGGIGLGHGGDTPQEYRVPIIMYGDGVTKGKVMEYTNMIYDNAATVCGLLDVEMPRECRGTFLWEAFEPRTGVCYVPIPFVHPYGGSVPAGEKVRITCDVDGAEIYYTLDGSEPTVESIKYEGPFELKGPVVIKAVGYKNGNYSWVTTNSLYPAD